MIPSHLCFMACSAYSQAKDKKFLGEFACDKEYLEDMLTELSTHTHANKLNFYKELNLKVISTMKDVHNIIMVYSYEH